MRNFRTVSGAEIFSKKSKKGIDNWVSGWYSNKAVRQTTGCAAKKVLKKTEKVVDK